MGPVYANIVKKAFTGTARALSRFLHIPSPDLNPIMRSSVNSMFT